MEMRGGAAILHLTTDHTDKHGILTTNHTNTTNLSFGDLGLASFFSCFAQSTLGIQVKSTLPK
jgi:hypothetical protein